MKESIVGLFIDLENTFWGMQKRHRQKLTVSAVKEKAAKYGPLALGYAVADWSETGQDKALIYPERLKRDLRAAGIEAVDTPKSSRGDNKNLADMKLAVAVFKTLKHRQDIGTYMLMTSDGIFVDVVNMILQDFRKNVVIAGVPPISLELVRCVGEERCDPLITAVPESNGGADSQTEVFIRRMAEWEEKMAENKLAYLGYQVLVDRLLRDAAFNIAGRTEAERLVDKLISNGIVERYAHATCRGERNAFRLNRNHAVVQSVLASRSGR